MMRYLVGRREAATAALVGVLAAAWLLAAPLVSPAQAADAPGGPMSGAGGTSGGPAPSALKRWAILATPALQASGLPELLTAALTSEPELTLVERDEIAAVLKELTLDRALGVEGTGERLRLGKLLRADALLILVDEQRDTAGFIRVAISDAAAGARLSTDFLACPPMRDAKLAEPVVAQLAALVRDTRRRFPQGVQQISGVPNFVSRDLTHDYDYLQDQLAYVLQNGLAAWPGYAVLEVEEAQAIQRELDVAGARLGPRVVPCFIEGDYRVTPAATTPATGVPASAPPVARAGAAGVPPTHPPSSSTSRPFATPFIAGRPLAAIELTLVIKDATGVRATVERRAETVEELATWLQREAPRRALAPAATLPHGSGSNEPPLPTPPQPALTDAQQLALLSGRAETFGRQSDYDHSIALREACLLIWPEDVAQRKALLTEYCRLLSGVRVPPGYVGTRQLDVGQAAHCWRRILAHLEHLMRRQVLAREQVRLTLQAVYESQSAFAFRPRVATRTLPPTDASQRQMLEVLAQADLEKRRFVLEVLPLMDSLPDDEASASGTEDPEAIRRHAQWFRTPLGIDALLYLPAGARPHAWWQSDGPPFPNDAADLQYVLDVLEHVARGRGELVLFMPLHVLAREFVPEFTPAYTDAELDAFIAKLCASEYTLNQAMGRMCRDLRTFSQTRPRDAAAVAAAVARLSVIAAEYPQVVSPWSDGDRLRYEVATLREILPRVAAGEDITRPAGRAPSSAPAVPPPLDYLPASVPSDPPPEYEPAHSYPGGAPPAPPPAEFDVTPVPLLLHPRAHPERAEPLKLSFTGVLPCDGRFDVFWSTSGFVALHLRPGELWETQVAVTAVQDVAWDGRFVWVGCPDKLLALNAHGDVVLEVGSPEGLPLHDLGLSLAGMEPGKLLAVGSLAPDARVWCAWVTVTDGKAAAQVFHEAKHVLAPADPEWLPTVDPGLAFHPGRIHRWVLPTRPDQPLWVVDRTFGNEYEPSPHGLLIDPTGPTVGVLPARHPGAMGRVVGFLPDGSYFVNPHGGSVTAGPFRWIPAPGARDASGELVHAFSGRWDARTTDDVFDVGGDTYLWCGELLRWDPQTQSARSLGQHEPDDLFWWHRGTSALLGLVAWFDYGQMVRIVPHDRATLTSAPSALRRPSPTTTAPAVEVVGGVVHDAGGQPLSGAQVYLLNDYPPGMVDTPPFGMNPVRTVRPYDYLAITGPDGRWRLTVRTLEGDGWWTRVGHPALSDQALEYRRLAPAQLEALRRGALEWLPAPPRVLSGRVLRADGAPAEHAAVTMTYDSVLVQAVRLSQTTDAAGTFRFEQPPPGIVSLVVSAPGWAPACRPVYLDVGPATVEFRLEPARVLRMRVVDEANQPIPDVQVGLYRWYGRRDIQWSATSDAAGRCVWDQAPANTVWYGLHKDGFESQDSLALIADGAEHTIHLRHSRVLTVHGEVVDAADGKPIAHYTVGPSYRWYPAPSYECKAFGAETPAGPVYRLAVVDRSRPPLDDAQVEHVLPTPRPEPEVWFAADGYAPQRLALPREGGTDVERNVRLQPDAGLHGVVRRADGTPAEGVGIGLGAAGIPLNFIGEMDWRDGRSGADGRFTLPAPARDYLIIAAHRDLGFAMATAAQFAASGELVLQPWARIDGVCHIGPYQGAFEDFELDWPGPENGSRYTVPAVVGRWECRADQQGRFALERMPPGIKLQLRRSAKFISSEPGYGPDLHYRVVQVEPGQTLNLVLDPLGRPLRARVAKVEGTDLPMQALSLCGYLYPVFPDRRPTEYAAWNRAEQLAWDKKFRASAEARALLPVSRNYMLALSPDGSVTAADVVPGSYWMSVRALIAGWGDDNGWQWERDITIPPPEDPHRPTPFDVGGLTLTQTGDQR